MRNRISEQEHFMNDFTFIHAADLHLGSPLTGLALKDPDIARRFASAGRRAFEDLVSQAIEIGAAFLIVAGDVYDGDWSDNTIGLFFARQVARLDRAGIPVILVRGNHDAESVITKAITLPDSVRTFPTTRADTHRLEHLRVALHGRSFPNRAVEENYALSYPAPLPGWFNIGVLHTSCTGHAAHATYAPCSVADLTGRGYAYWALGHVHEYAELAQDPFVVFPATCRAARSANAARRARWRSRWRMGGSRRSAGSSSTMPASTTSRSTSARRSTSGMPSRRSRPPCAGSPRRRRAGSSRCGCACTGDRPPMTASPPTART